MLTKKVSINLGTLPPKAKTLGGKCCGGTTGGPTLGHSQFFNPVNNSTFKTVHYNMIIICDTGYYFQQQKSVRAENNNHSK